MLNGAAQARRVYEQPRLEVAGSLVALTQAVDKKFGFSDGFTFQGVSITNAS
ncbi:MAG: lasso RiPP family leader peptide-containing protein [Dehalococcoidia bacterium]|nr:lasso RiPP family leader peptide-containing protein [Dehalococcoidia bacterium]